MNRGGAVMLTAMDDARGALLDVTALDGATLDGLSGYRVPRRNGHVPVCRWCRGGVCLVRRHGGLTFWRHLPGEGQRCLYADVTQGGESAEHLAAKQAIVSTLRRRHNGWSAYPEHPFRAAGDLVIADVFAEHAQPAAHQAPTLWEVQLAYQPHGEFVDRTARARRVAGHRTAWVTPHADALGAELGMVTDPTGAMVVDRVYADLDMTTRLPPMSVSAFLDTTVAKRRASLLWAQSGEYGEWLAFPVDAVSGPLPARTPRRNAPPTDHADREWCEREGTPAPVANAFCATDGCALTATDRSRHCWRHTPGWTRHPWARP